MNSSLLARLKWCMIIVAVAAGVLCVVGALQTATRDEFFQGYLFGYLFCLGLSLGSLCLLMLHNLTGGAWGTHLRPIARLSAMLLPLFVVLFIPLCFGLPSLYPWARGAEVAHQELLLHRQPYFNLPFFFARAVVYFAVWITLAVFMTRPGRASRALSAAGLILYLMTMTHAGIDWVMSRDTEFYSTTFGFILTVGQTLAALALCIILRPLISQPEVIPVPPNESSIGPIRALHIDLGNLLLTLVILWAYVSFMQLLVVWMGNSGDDNSWYLQRGFGGGGDSTAWRVVALILVVFHFFVPFYLLLFRAAKQRRRSLQCIAWILLAAHVVEAYWLVAPSGHGKTALFRPDWLDAAAFIAIAALWFAGLLFLMARIPPAAEEPPLAEHLGVTTYD